MDLNRSLLKFSGPALIDADRGWTLTYQELNQLVFSIREKLDTRPSGLVFCFVDLSVSSIVSYLGALTSDHCVCLIDAEAGPEVVARLFEAYSPDLVLGRKDSSYASVGYQREKTFHEASVSIWSCDDLKNEGSIHEANKLLLPTSGSTGNPKMVRLSVLNLNANANAIAKYLELDSSERPIASLPFQYSYGLSVLNSHLVVGGCLILTKASFLQPKFWDTFRSMECTSFAGVPFQYTSLRRIGFDRFDLPSLRTMTQAGGKLNERFASWFHEISQRKSFRFFIMYGQTEATARISYLPPESFSSKLGSVGTAIPGGKLLIEDDQGEPAERGNVVYRGPNVSLGYASSRRQLAYGDFNQGRLVTGDLGHLDETGHLYLTGRSNRFAKVFGLRINLADIESAIDAEIVAVGLEDCIKIAHDASLTNPSEVRRFLANRFHVNQSAFKMCLLEQIPRTSSGKPNHYLVKELLGGY